MPERHSQNDHRDTASRFDRLAAAGLALFPLLLYLAGALWLSIAGSHPLAAVSAFDAAALEQEPGFRYLAASALASIGALLFLFASPAWLGVVALRGLGREPPTAHAWSIAINSAALILLCAVLRLSIGIDRLGIASAWLAWTLLLAGVALRHGRLVADTRLLWQRYAKGLLAGAGLVLFTLLFFAREHALQCFSGDGVESYELARSLRGHFLPYWEIEATRSFGTPIVNPALISSYWTFALQLLLGETEFATRLPFFVYWLAIFLVCHRLHADSGNRSFLALLCLALAVFLSFLLFTFYTTYSPYLADLANPGVPDALLTLFLFLSFDCLHKRDLAGWIAMLLLASLVLYAGPVFMALSFAAAWFFRPVERAPLFRSAAAGAGTFLLIAGLYLAWGAHRGLLQGWALTIELEYLTDYFTNTHIPRIPSAFLYLGYFVLCSGGVTVLALGYAFLRTRWERTVSATALAYLLIVIASAYKNLHYLGPLILVPALIWGIRAPGTRPSRWAALDWFTPLSLGICIALLWPPARPVFTLSRELGARTTILTTDYEEACLWTPYLPDTLFMEGELGWFLSRHVWVKYSALESSPSELRPLLLTDKPANPRDYPIVITGTPGVSLYARDWETVEWMSSRRPLSGEERFPWILSPVAPPPPRFFPIR